MMKPDKTSGIPWPVILTVLFSAVVSAWLVLYRQWEPSSVLLIVAGSVLGFCCVVIAIVWMTSDKTDRQAFLGVIVRTIKADWMLIVEHFVGRKQ